MRGESLSKQVASQPFQAGSPRRGSFLPFHLFPPAAFFLSAGVPCSLHTRGRQGTCIDTHTYCAQIHPCGVQTVGESPEKTNAQTLGLSGSTKCMFSDSSLETFSLFASGKESGHVFSFSGLKKTLDRRKKHIQIEE